MAGVVFKNYHQRQQSATIGSIKMEAAQWHLHLVTHIISVSHIHLQTTHAHTQQALYRAQKVFRWLH